MNAAARAPEPAELWLSDLLGRRVDSAGDGALGRVVEVGVERWEARPRVSAIAFARRGHDRFHVVWDDIEAVDEQAVRVRSGATVRPGTPENAVLLLARDVLDALVVDVAGKRIRRVSDVCLALAGRELSVVAVDTGWRAIMRRLGLRRRPPRRGTTAIDAGDVHIASSRGHELQLATTGSAIHRFSGPELSELVARLPPGRGADVLSSVGPAAAAGALSAARPRLGGRLLQALPADHAREVLRRMPVDDAVAALRHVEAGHGAKLLEAVSGGRETELRRLLAFPASTAGGLMTTDIRIATAAEPAERIRSRLAAEPPPLEGLTTVFVVDEQGRLAGALPPSVLLAGSSTPRPVPALRVDTPLADVIDVFAVEDVLALPVVDAGDRPVGAVAIDDVLEELLVERLPQHRRRYHRARGRERAPA